MHLRPLLSDLHPEVIARYYGCGTPLPHIYQTLLAKHDFVMLVGADLPQMTATDLLGHLTG